MRASANIKEAIVEPMYIRAKRTHKLPISTTLNSIKGAAYIEGQQQRDQ